MSLAQSVLQRRSPQVISYKERYTGVGTTCEGLFDHWVTRVSRLRKAKALAALAAPIRTTSGKPTPW